MAETNGIDCGEKWFSYPLWRWHLGSHRRAYGFWLALSGLLVLLITAAVGLGAGIAGAVGVAGFFSVFGAAYASSAITVSLFRHGGAAFLLARPFSRREVHDTLFLGGLMPVLLLFAAPVLLACLLYFARGTAVWGPQLLTLAAATVFLYSLSNVVSLYREKAGNKIVAALLSVFLLLFLVSLTSSALGFALAAFVTGTGGPVFGSAPSLWPELWALAYLALATVCYLVNRRMFQKLDLEKGGGNE